MKQNYKKSWFVKIIFVVSLFVILFITGVTYKHISELSKTQQEVIQTYKLNVELEQILSYLKDAETGQRGFIITQDSLYLEPFFKSRSKINNTFAELKALTKKNPKHQQSLKDLNGLIEARLHNFEIASKMALRDQTDVEKFKQVFLEGKAYMDAIRKKLNGMLALENNRLAERKESYENTIKFTPIFLYGLIILTLVLLYIAYAKISSDLDKLRKTNQQLETFKEATNQAEIINKHGSWRWNVEDDKFYFSDNLYRLLGEKPDAFKATIANFNSYVHPEDRKKLEEQVAQMKIEKDLPFINYRVVHKNGTIKYLKAYGKSISNLEGKEQLIGTTTDITDEIDYANTLETRNKELELNNKELQAFNYVASHDLQEPLRKIQTFLSRLEDKESDNFSESGKKYMERINFSAKRMRNLIDDLLQFSRTNKSDEILVVKDLNELLEDAKQELSEIITKENAIIIADILPKVKVIPFQIEQLFTNLLSNSLKYKALDKRLQIKISYTLVAKNNDFRLKNGTHKKYHCFVFKDNGIGFDAQYTEKIFELFSRLHNKNEYSGTGIGLSICKKITDNHSGFIFANGTPNQGANFTVFLPS